MEYPEKSDWWRLNKQEFSTESIEWTPDEGGWVRAKIDSISNWGYARCKNARYALSIAIAILTSQRRSRE